MWQIQRIIVPVDYSDCSRAALEYGLRIADQVGGTVDVLHVSNVPPFLEDIPSFDLWSFPRTEPEMKAFLATIEIPESVHLNSRFEVGDPEQVILRLATAERYDLIVMGTHGRTGMSHLLIGSIAENIVRTAPCPVVTVRAATRQVWAVPVNRLAVDNTEQTLP